MALTAPRAAIALRVLAGFLAAAAVLPGAQMRPALAQPAQALSPLTIVTSGGRHSFQVELAETNEDRARGLMFRRSMAPDRGMLFDFKVDEPVSMWMQNTYISLDMLFIRRDGTIARIAERTEPLSTRTIASGEPVPAVLELVGGTAARLGIRPGDKVEHPLFKSR